jgi:hypothetical protein
MMEKSPRHAAIGEKTNEGFPSLAPASAFEDPLAVIVVAGGETISSFLYSHAGKIRVAPRRL